MKQYTVTGMSCAACSSRVEKAVSKVSGVTTCSVNLLTNSMGVEGDAAPEDVIRAVTEAGYGASLKDSDNKSREIKDDSLKDTVTPGLIKRLAASVVFLIVLMYFSMGHMMWGFKVPAFFEDNHVAMGLLQLILTVAVMVINQQFFISGYKSLVRMAPNMDTLVALGATAAFVYSTYALFAMTGAQVRGDHESVMAYMDEFYFESAAMILTLITVGKTLEARSKGKTTNALKGLMKLAPKTAVILKDGVETTVPLEQVKKDDIFVVRPGETIPVDGTVLEGAGAVNESALTGESIPVDKSVGDSVSAGTINSNGFLRCRAVNVGEDTTLSQIIKLVSDASATKAPIAKAADKVSGVFVPLVIAIAVITFAVWMIAGEGVGFSLARAVSVLVISCPCALGLATPVAIMVGNGVGAGNGILFKTAASLEETGKIKIVALDKTGTITAGTPKVTDIIPALGVDKENLVTLAFSLEKQSEHPLAGAVVEYGEERQISALPVDDFSVQPGNGLLGTINGQKVLGGKADFIKESVEIPAEYTEQAKKLSDEGKTPLFFAVDNNFAGIIFVADIMKEDSQGAINELKEMGIRVVMLTGDNENTAAAIGRKAGVDEVIGGVMPDGKEKIIKELIRNGKTAMVGDGINDAPALTRADIGIAIGAGTDIAIDAADVVLMKSRLSDVPGAIRLSRATLRNIQQNLFWAFFYNVIGIPLAAGVWIPAFGWQLNPMFAAAAMSLSSFCVVSNALRLNFTKLHKKNKMPEKYGKEAVKPEKYESEDTNMKKTIIIQGMMCGHCEATVKKALEAVDGVSEALVSHENKTATVTLNKEVADEVLIKAVEDKDYKVVSVE